jgi:phosphoribosylaminoimidazole-succinocarboxamide synthase
MSERPLSERPLSEPLHKIDIPGVRPRHEGKVRSVYDAGDDLLLLVATDRISAYDSILPTAIPDKGRVLTQLSVFWLRTLAAASPHHLVSVERADFPAPFRDHPELEGRSMLCKKARRVDIECVVRGYLTGSGYKEYKKDGTLNGEPLPAGLIDGSRLDPPRFTPTTKAEQGHDLPMTREEVVALVGRETAEELEQRSLEIYLEAAARSLEAGLILADTKFEFGWIDGRLCLIDEVLSPDASRFWDEAAYGRGRLESFDKQIVRDHLDRTGWNHEPPAPALPEEVVQATRRRYLEAATRLMGEAEARTAGLALGVTA